MSSDCSEPGCLRGTVPGKPACWVHGGIDQRGRYFTLAAVLLVGGCVVAGGLVGALIGLVLDLRTVRNT